VAGRQPRRELPLGRAAYGRIAHLPGSRVGAGDRTVDAAHAARCFVGRAGEVVLVEEKLDGSCVAIARLGDDVVALGREGARAAESPNQARQLFAAWLAPAPQRARFAAVLQPGEWLVGEWLALVHGTRYALAHEPLVVFDLMRRGAGREPERAPRRVLAERAARAGLTLPARLHDGALPAEAALARLAAGGGHGADRAEGVIYRVEAGERVALVAKLVRADKRDGALLPENSGAPALWNWRP